LKKTVEIIMNHVPYQIMYEELGPLLSSYRLLFDNLGIVDLTMEPEDLDLVARGAHHVSLHNRIPVP
jgi:hypothetical protein